MKYVWKYIYNEQTNVKCMYVFIFFIHFECSINGKLTYYLLYFLLNVFIYCRFQFLYTDHGFSWWYSFSVSLFACVCSSFRPCVIIVIHKQRLIKWIYAWNFIIHIYYIGLSNNHFMTSIDNLMIQWLYFVKWYRKVSRFSEPSLTSLRSWKMCARLVARSCQSGNTLRILSNVVQ